MRLTRLRSFEEEGQSPELESEGSEKKVSLNLCVSLIIHHDDNPLSL